MCTGETGRQEAAFDSFLFCKRESSWVSSWPCPLSFWGHWYSSGLRLLRLGGRGKEDGEQTCSDVSQSSSGLVWGM